MLTADGLASPAVDAIGKSKAPVIRALRGKICAILTKKKDRFLGPSHLQ